MRQRHCAVCGKSKELKKFGDGITCPKTTCLDCKENIKKFIEPKVVMNVKKVREHHDRQV